MKKISILFALFVAMVAYAQKPFVGVWKTNKKGEISFGSVGNFNYTYEKVGDPSVTGSGAGVPAKTTLNLANGEYTIRISPSNPAEKFRLNSLSNLIELKEWGDINWADNLSDLFRGCSTLKITATDSPTFANVTDMSHMFYYCREIDNIPGIENWDVSKVTNMKNMFNNAAKFNGNISGWNVSQVEDMSGMFAHAQAFNQDISNWKVGNVKNMGGVNFYKGGMFEGAKAFNQDLSKWDVSKVENMSYMFNGATAFNQDLSNWNVSNVNNMQYMFSDAVNFNQNMPNWKTGKVKNMANMFNGAIKFNGDISNWDVEQVTNMNSMFNGASEFNSDISKWTVDNVAHMNSMFFNAIAFNSNLSEWSVGKVQDMSSMFENAKAFNQDLSKWDVTNVTNMRRMFNRAGVFTSDLSKWNVGSVTNMTELFWNAAEFESDLSNWNVGNVENMEFMFHGAEKFNSDLSKWNVSKAKNMNRMFVGARKFNQNLGSWTIPTDAKLGGIFSFSGMDCENYSKTLKGWAENPNTGRDVVFSSQAVTYGAAAKPYRQKLIDIKWWKISGDTFDAGCTADLATEDVAQKPQFFIIKPVKDELHIQGLDGIKSIEIYSANGSLVKTLSTNQRSVSNLSKGVYILKINTQNATYTEKIIKD